MNLIFNKYPLIIHDEDGKEVPFQCGPIYVEEHRNSLGEITDALNFNGRALLEEPIEPFQGKQIVLQCLASCYVFSCSSEKEIESSGAFFANLFASFLQGAVLGWNVCEETTLIRIGESERVPFIRIDKWIAQINDRNKLCEIIGLDKKSRRRMVLGDVLSFYLDKYETDGPNELWDDAALITARKFRLPYTEDEIENAQQQLLREKILTGTFTELALDPDEFDHALNYVQSSIHERIDHLKRVGIILGVLPQITVKGEGRSDGSNVTEWARGASELTVAIAFTDVVGSTKLCNTLGDVEWQAIRQDHLRQAADLINERTGILIKNMGDGVLALFHNARSGLDFAVRLFEEARAAGLNIRAGIHIGQVNIAGNDVSGQQVHFADRVMKFAKNGGIILSDRAKQDIDQCGDSLSKKYSWRNISSVKLEGFTDSTNLGQAVF